VTEAIMRTCSLVSAFGRCRYRPVQYVPWTAGAAACGAGAGYSETATKWA